MLKLLVNSGVLFRAQDSVCISAPAVLTSLRCYTHQVIINCKRLEFLAPIQIRSRVTHPWYKFINKHGWQINSSTSWNITWVVNIQKTLQVLEYKN